MESGATLQNHSIRFQLQILCRPARSSIIQNFLYLFLKQKRGQGLVQQVYTCNSCPTQHCHCIFNSITNRKIRIYSTILHWCILVEVADVWTVMDSICFCVMLLLFVYSVTASIPPDGIIYLPPFVLMCIRLNENVQAL